MAAHDLVCSLENLQGFMDALISIRWKNKQEAMVELSEHGLVIMAQELNCLQAKAYFRKELFEEYTYTSDVRQRFGVSLSLLIDTVNTFLSAAASSQSSPATLSSPALALCYPGPDMELLLKMSVQDHVSVGAEIRTLLPSWSPDDFAMEDLQAPSKGLSSPVSFAIKSQVLKEVMEDLEWPGSDVKIIVAPQPAVVTFLAQGHGDLQIDLPFDGSNNLFIDFQCDRNVAFSYKYKYLSAVTAGMPAGALKDSGGSKLTMSQNGLLKVQHIVNVRQGLGMGPGLGFASNAGLHPRGATAFSQQAFPSQDGTGSRYSHMASRPSSYVEFFVMPSEEELDEDERTDD